MEIQLNHQTRDIASDSSVQQLLQQVVGEKQKGIAVAINNRIIPKASWAGHLIQANDQILIIKATQGG